MRMTRKLVTTIVLAAVANGLLAAAGLSQDAGQSITFTFRIGGVVTDTSGAPISRAKVVFVAGPTTETGTTDDAGKFRFEFENTRPIPGTITVTVQGFEPFVRDLRAGKTGFDHLEIVLTPATVTSQITVTATRTPERLKDTAADVVVLGSQELASSGAETLDGALRAVPGFKLFRRSSSLTSNPTSQGVSLRGVGATAASRALVLADGIPINDPYGGWVYWDRVPQVAVRDVEVVRGGASDLYGSKAMGGVVNILTRRPIRTTLDLETSYGNENTPGLSVDANIRQGNWGLGFAGEAFHTDGWILVPESLRGPIDSRAGVDYRTGIFTIDRAINDRVRLFASASVLGEARQNGKIDEQNATHLRQLWSGGDWQSNTLGTFAFRAWGGPQLLDQNFFAVGAGRASERLTDVQRVPAQQLAGSVQWSRPAGLRQTLVAGVEAGAVRGSSNELLFTPAAPPTPFVSLGALSSAADATGSQHTVGLYGEDLIRITSRWMLTLGFRFDHWRNYDALSTARPLATAGPITVTSFPDRSEQALSPRLSLLRKVSDNVSLSASAYRSFRSPTLDELYRPFRLGNVYTLANATLLAERLTGAETGANVSAFQNKLTVRGVFFWSDITRPVESVTLSVTPSLITRQRQNLGRTRSRGVDIDATLNVTPSLSINAGYEYADAIVTSFSANPALIGLWLPEIPHQQFTVQARYSNRSGSNPLARFDFSLQGRAIGLAYDDDQNLLPLNHFFSLDALVSRPLITKADKTRLELFAAAENVFGTPYQIARTPALNVGPPALVRLGIRLSLGAR